MTGKGLGPPDGLWSGTRPTSETTTLWADTLLTLWQCPAAEVPTVHGEWLGKGMLPPLPALQELQAILSTGPSTACPPVGRRLSLAPLHARIGDKTMLTLNTQVSTDICINVLAAPSTVRVCMCAGYTHSGSFTRTTT